MIFKKKAKPKPKPAPKAKPVPKAEPKPQPTRSSVAHDRVLTAEGWQRRMAAAIKKGR